MAGITADKALVRWLELGLLDPETHRRLADDLATLEQGPGRTFAVISSFGGVLVGIGIILFVGSHWDAMAPWSRIATVILAHGLLCGLAWLAQGGGHEGIATALWLSATLALGAGIFLIGQIFNFTLTYWQGPFIWMIGALVMAWATRSKLQVFFAVPLAILAFGWYGGGQGWFMDDQWEFLFGRNGIRAMLPHLGLALACTGALLRSSRDWAFASRVLTGWGMLLVVLPMTIATAHWEAARWLFQFSGSWKYLASFALATGLIGWLLWQRRGAAEPGDRLLLATWLVLLALAAFAAGMDRDNQWLLVLFSLIVFGYAMLGAWTGTRINYRALVNVSVVLGACVVLVQYFSWTWTLMDRAGGFILSGIVLLGVAGFAENRRRALVRRMAA